MKQQKTMSSLDNLEDEEERGRERKDSPSQITRFSIKLK